ncbi:hypothetical protein [Amycolatopsis samaneae]|uniref:Uncharacterized protein n=1 Tax=Amycolatopsis samaneae TaxID=664691 RepID=A0ABW5GS90_9PSEU
MPELLLAEDRIDFDVDLRELQGQDRLDLFCGFLRAIGTCLAKPVSMATEGGGPGEVFLRFDPVADEVRLTAS